MSAFPSEGADLALDDHIGDLVDVVEPVCGDDLGLGLPLGQVGIVLRIGKDGTPSEEPFEEEA